MTTITQPSMSGGELAPALHGRVDLARYLVSLETCKNFVASAYGGIRNRQGTRYAGTAKSAAQIRLIPFSFNYEQNYVLELGNKYGRVFSRGRAVLDGSLALIEFPTPWPTEVLRDLKFAQSADVMTVCHPKYPPHEIRRTTTSWECGPYKNENGPFQELNTNEGIFVWADKPDIGGATITANAAIFKLDTEGQSFMVEQKDYGIPWEVSASVTAGDVRRSDGKYYRALNSAKCGTLRPIHESGKWWDGQATASNPGAGVEWLFLHSGYGVARINVPAADFKSATVTNLTRMPDSVSAGGTGASASYKINTLVPVATLDKTVFAVSGLPPNTATSFNIHLVCYDGQGIMHTYDGAAISGVVSGSDITLNIPWVTLDSGQTGTLFVQDEAVPNSITPVAASGTVSTVTHKWAFGSWGPRADQGYPACVCYFQQRLVFGGSTGFPQTLWMTRTGSYHDFSRSTPIRDDDALSYELSSGQIDGIKSMIALDRLVLLTGGGNYVTATAEAVTPGNISAKLQNYFGVSNLRPLGVGNTVLYHGVSGTVRDMGYEFASDSYTGNDLTVMANHLVRDNQILEWDFQQSPFPVVWMVRDDGVLLGMTYHKEQAVVGWHQHVLGGSGKVESVAVINECGRDKVYLSVNRGGVRTIEYMEERTSDLYDGLFVDCSSSYDGRNADPTWTITLTGSTMTSTADLWTAGNVGHCQMVIENSDGTLSRYNVTAYGGARSVTVALASGAAAPGTTSSWAKAIDGFSGLPAVLYGQTVNILVDGLPTTGTVSGGGAVTLASPGFVVHIGFPITAIARTLKLVVPGQQPHLESRKLNSVVNLYLENSRSCWIGQDETDMVEQKLGTSKDEATPVTSYTGILKASIPSSWSRDGQFTIKHIDPTPLSIVALIPDIALGSLSSQQGGS